MEVTIQATQQQTGDANENILYVFSMFERLAVQANNKSKPIFHTSDRYFIVNCYKGSCS